MNNTPLSEKIATLKSEFEATMHFIENPSLYTPVPDEATIGLAVDKAAKLLEEIEELKRKESEATRLRLNKVFLTPIRRTRTIITITAPTLRPPLKPSSKTNKA